MAMNNVRMSLVTGIIVFTGMIVFFGGILWLSGNRFFTNKDLRFYIDFTDAAGLQDDAPVYMRGFRIGWTRDVEFGEEAIRVAVDIRRKYPVPEDSRAEIRMLNFMGEKAVFILPGTSDTNLMREAVLRGESKDIMVLAGDILTTAKKKIEEGDLGETISQVKDTVGELRSLVSGVEGKVKSIDVASINHQVASLGDAGRSLRKFLENAEEKTSRISASGRETMERLNQTMERLDGVFEDVSALSSELQTLVRDIRYGGGTASELITNKDLFMNLKETISEIQALIEDVKRRPKKYFKFSLF
jgi:phospholipid/cholesterol/gamma-HCH transport system substrate-binding protein